MPLNPDARQCKSRAKHSGEQCKNPAVAGYEVCRMHGANPKNRGGTPKGRKKPEGSGGRPFGNSNARKHGAYSAKLPPDERKLFEQNLEQYLSDVPNPSVTDRRALERLAILETKWQVAVTQGAPPDALDTLHRLLHRELKALQVTRESKDTARTSGTTPAEVMAALIAKVRERGALPPPQPVQAEIIDAEVVEVEQSDRPREG